jgi:hypothetical protein
MLCALASFAVQAHSIAATWRFDGLTQGLHDLGAKTIAPVESFEMTIAVHYPNGGIFFEQNDGVAVRSTGLPAISDQDGAGKINMLSVNGVQSAAAEAIAFSFSKRGYLTGIDFDGVKDETLEHFVFTSSGGIRINFFDSAADTTIPGAVTNAPPETLWGDVVYLLEGGGFDDEVHDLRIPFAPGQLFVLTYAELPPVNLFLYGVGDGARLQGITVVEVPEPATALIVLAGFVAPSIIGHTMRRRLSSLMN